MKDKRISARLQRLLPFVYLGGGLATVFAIDGAMAYPPALLLMAAAVFEWARHRRSRRPEEAARSLPAAARAPRDAVESEAHLMTIRWLKSYECGHPVIDEQHRELFDISNDLINSVLVRKPKLDIEAILRELVQHIHHHFTTEEQVLARTRYPLTQEHRDIHRVLLARASDLEDRYRAGRLAVSDLVGFISYEVISAHIMTEDLKFALRER